MKDNKFYICRHCGNLVGMIHASGVNVVCCGEKMQALEAGAVDASHEKHVPVVTVSADKVEVCVGSVMHPMTPEHSIEWVYLETNMGGQRKALKAGEEPNAVFALTEGEKPVCVYAYCNLHGLWKAEL